MSSDGNVFQSNFRGYDKTEVVEHLKKLYGEGEKTIAELNRKIDDISYKNDRIKKEIEKIKQENSTVGRSKDFLDFLEFRLKNIQEFMNADAENEMKTIESASLDKDRSLDEEINDLKKYFGKIQDNFNILIKTVLEPRPVSENNGFKVIQYTGKIERKKMLENDNTDTPKVTIDTHIIGKSSGKDIKDRSGDLIVAKGEIITEEIIEKADDAGKLSELIINMAIPGVDDNFVNT
ncbi:MAG: hypothetical protein AB9844_02835 [Clostridiaceae bacterium]